MQQPENQDKIVSYLCETLEEYRKINKNRNEKLLKIYAAISTFEEEKQADWMTNFKVNKAHEIVERVLPRIIAKNPRWIVTPKLNDFYPDQLVPQIDPDLKTQAEELMKEQEASGQPLPPEQQAVLDEFSKQGKAYNDAIEKKKEQANMASRAVQDYLEYAFDEYNYEDYIRAFAKQMIVYGKGWAKVGYRYETMRKMTDDNIESENEDGEKVTKRGKKIQEVVTGEYPIIDVKSWTEVLCDPRYKRVEDMPAFFEVIQGVRLGDIKKKEHYFNIDKLKDVCGLARDLDFNDYKRKVQSIAGIQDLKITAPVDKNSLTLVTAWALWEDDSTEDAGSEEKLYEFIFVEELRLLISMKEVTKIPYVEANAFEDTDTNFAVGFVEPILGLQDELNFQKNAAINFINQALNRTFIWSPNSNIDPRDIISKPFGIIPTTGEVSAAMANLVELPMRQIPSDYFQMQNDIERQIQGQTFTVDTTNQKGQQALTDTATGARIELFESNVVLDQVRKNFEQALQKIAYKILQEAFENMDDNIILKKIGAESWWDLNKKTLEDAVTKYSIKVETGSSTYDDIENRRKDAMAWWNFLSQAQQAGQQVNFKTALEDIGATFEKKDVSKYLQTNTDMAAIAAKMPRIPKQDMPQGQMTPAQMTQQIAGGQIKTL